MKYLVYLTLLVALLFSATTAFANGDGPLFTDATLNGTVTDRSGNPINNITVHVYDLNQTGDMFAPSDYRSTAVRTVDTETDGSFELTGMPEGTYALRLHDYYGRYATTLYPNTLKPGDATRLILRNNNVTTVNAIMDVGGSIDPTISLNGPRSLGSYTIQVWRHVDGLGFRLFRSDYVDNSTPMLGGLPTGPYRVLVFSSVNVGNDYVPIQESFGGGNDIYTGEDVWVTQGETVTLDWALADPIVRLYGRVTGPDNQPIPNIRVLVHKFNPTNLPGEEWLHPYAYASTDGDGNYEAYVRRDGQYKINFFDWDDRYPETHNGNMPTLGGAPVIEFDDEDSIAVDVMMKPGAQLEGQVLGAHGSAEFRNVGIRLYRWNDHDAWLSSYNVDIVDRRDGSFTVRNLQSGQYRFMLDGQFMNGMRFVKWIGGDSLETATSFFVETGEIAAMDPITLSDFNATISGRVTNDAGQPIPNVRVYANGSDWRHGASALTDANGTYHIEHLAADTYHINLARVPHPYVDPNTMPDDAFGMFTVGAGDALQHDISLAYGSTINGRVTFDMPVDYLSISVYRLVGDEWQYAASNGFGPDGWYSFKRLPAGTYTMYYHGVKYNSDAPYSMDAVYGGVQELEDAESVALGTNVVVNGVNIHLGEFIDYGSSASFEPTSFGSISGRVTGNSGEPVANVEVLIYRYFSPPRGQAYWTEVPVKAMTDANGNYTLSGIPLGQVYALDQFRIGFDGAQVGYSTEYYGDTVMFDSAEIIELDATNTSASGIDTVLMYTGCQVNTCIAE